MLRIRKEPFKICSSSPSFYPIPITPFFSYRCAWRSLRSNKSLAKLTARELSSAMAASSRIRGGQHRIGRCVLVYQCMIFIQPPYLNSEFLPAFPACCVPVNLSASGIFVPFFVDDFSSTSPTFVLFPILLFWETIRTLVFYHLLLAPFSVLVSLLDLTKFDCCMLIRYPCLVLTCRLGMTSRYPTATRKPSARCYVQNAPYKWRSAR